MSYEKIPKEVIDKIKNNTSIVDFIKKYVDLKKKGNNFFGLCPFQKEKTPSFSVNEEKQIFHCFSCGRGGNVFQFLMDIKNISFYEAVVEVAKFSNVNISLNNYKGTQDSPLVSSLKKIYHEAQLLYNHILMNTERGSNALNYLHKRGISDELISKFNIGFAPDDDILIKLLKSKNELSYEDLFKSGLFINKNNNELYDRFKNRIMFPICNLNDETIAFSGRILRDLKENEKKDVPKYINSPETPLFNKSKTLFNLNLAKNSVYNDRCIYLFEGFMDVISAYGAGIKNSVASMGTSFTYSQLRIINKMAKKLIVCYDGDDPGIEAINRALDLSYKMINVKPDVVIVPDKMDPDEFINKRGRDSFINLISKNVQTFTSFKLFYIKRNLNMKNEGDKIKYINKSLQLISQLKSSIDRSIYIQQIVEETEVDKKALELKLKSIDNNNKNNLIINSRLNKKNDEINNEVKTYADNVDKYEIAERSILYIVFHNVNLISNVREKNIKFIHEKYQIIFNKWSDFVNRIYSSSVKLNITDFFNEVDSSLYDTIASIESLAWPTDDVDDKIINSYCDVINDFYLTKELKNIKQKINDAQRLGNNDELGKLMTNYIHLIRDIKNKNSGRIINYD